MTWLEMLVVTAAGAGAGAINTVVGSGTLITFPTLLALGVPSVTANVSNCIGLVPGSVSGAIGYRRELSGQRSRALRLGTGSLIGATIGAILLLVLPSSAFEAIVPALILIGCVLVALQPRISARVERHHAAIGGVPQGGARWVWPAVMLTGVYGGYFGAAQGVLLMAIMGIGINEDLQRLNGLKNVLAAIANGVAGLVFMAVADVDWLVVVLIALGAVAGSIVAARYGRRMPAQALRAVIVVVGVIALVAFAVT